MIDPATRFICTKCPKNKALWRNSDGTALCKPCAKKNNVFQPLEPPEARAHHGAVALRTPEELDQAVAMVLANAIIELHQDGVDQEVTLAAQGDYQFEPVQVCFSRSAVVVAFHAYKVRTFHDEMFQFWLQSEAKADNLYARGTFFNGRLRHLSGNVRGTASRKVIARRPLWDQEVTPEKILEIAYQGLGGTFDFDRCKQLANDIIEATGAKEAFPPRQEQAQATERCACGNWANPALANGMCNACNKTSAKRAIDLDDLRQAKKAKTESE